MLGLLVARIGQRYITHLNTARNSHAKNASVRRSAPLRNLPTLLIQITPFLLYLAGFVVGLLPHQPFHQLCGYSRNVGNLARAGVQC